MKGADSRVLDLRGDVLDSPDRSDLGLIERMMLFPDSEEDRLQAARSSLVEFAAQNPDAIPEECWKELFFISREAIPITRARTHKVVGVRSAA